MIVFEPDDFNKLPYDWSHFSYYEEPNFISKRLYEKSLENTNRSAVFCASPRTVHSLEPGEKLAVPFVIYSCFSLFRERKYARSSGRLIMHILNKKKIELCAIEIYNPASNGYSVPEKNLPPFAEENLEDDEIEQGFFTQQHLTINISDYFLLPAKNAVYEFYCSKFNIESNHVFVSVKIKNNLLFKIKKIIRRFIYKKSAVEGSS